MLNALKQLLRNNLPLPIQAIAVNTYAFLTEAEVPIINKAFFVVGAALSVYCSINAIAALNFFAIAKLMATCSAVSYISALICFKKSIINDAKWALTALKTDPLKILLSSIFYPSIFSFRLINEDTRNHRFPKLVTLAVGLLIPLAGFSLLNTPAIASSTGLTSTAFILSTLALPFCYYMMPLSMAFELLDEITSIPSQIWTNPKTAIRQALLNIVSFHDVFLNEEVLNPPDDSEPAAHEQPLRLSVAVEDQDANLPMMRISSFEMLPVAGVGNSAMSAATRSAYEVSEAAPPASIHLLKNQYAALLINSNRNVPSSAVPMSLDVASPHSPSHSHHDDQGCPSTRCSSEQLQAAMTNESGYLLCGTMPKEDSSETTPKKKKPRKPVTITNN